MTKYDLTKFTPKRVGDTIKASLDLLEKHNQMHKLLWELIAGICYEAPIPMGSKFRRFGQHAVAIETPHYWLVYVPGAKHLVEGMVKGTLGKDIVLPRPIGVLIPSGNTKLRRTFENPDGLPIPLYYAVARGKPLGDFEPSRCVVEIAQFYNVR